MEIKNININEIQRDEDQPRKYFDEEALSRLIQSIKDNGIEQPITVRKSEKGYIVIDGERRWRSSKEAGLKTMPCIITDKDDILEQQLRSDCLKEGLTVDELDRAIYKYYEELRTSQHLANNDLGQRKIAASIGKSAKRVQKAIDRFEFKRDNQEFTKAIEKKHNPENKPFSKVNSTIAMTDKLKDKPEVRKAVIEKVLSADKGKSSNINNDDIKKQVEYIAKNENIKTKEDAVQVIDNLINQKNLDISKDPRQVLKRLFFEFSAFVEKFENYNFNTPEVKQILKGFKELKEFREKVEDFQIIINQLED